MDRKEFLKMVGLGCGAMLIEPLQGHAVDAPAAAPTELEKAQQDREFMAGWLSDLLEGMHAQLDEPARLKLIAACGAGCFRRHQFKQDIAIEGSGDLGKLKTALKKVFGDDGVWQEKDEVHIRFNTRAHGCYCPVGRAVPVNKNDSFCFCHGASQQAIFAKALGRQFPVDVIDSVRRGGEHCHFIVHLGDYKVSRT